MKPISFLRRALLGAGIAATLAATLAAGNASAADWPTRPVRIVVASAPGSGGDILARMFGENFAKAWGQAFIVENKVGANGLIGNDAVAKSAPDGYTWLMSYALAVVVNPAMIAKMPYDTLKDLMPVVQVGAGGPLLVVADNFPARNIREFIDYARANAGKINVASFGIGSGGHLALEVLTQAANLKLNHVPYKSVPAIYPDLLGGNIGVAFVDPITVLPHVRSGKLRALMVSATRRPPQLPDVPTMTESGFRWDADTWYGLFAPGGTPLELARRMNQEVNRLMQVPEVRARFASLNLAEAPPRTVEQFTQTVLDDMAAWTRVVRAGNIKAE